MRGEQARQLRVGAAAPVVIGADRQHHDPTTPAGHQVGDERAALLLVAAHGERLLELVDREQHATVAVGLRGGVRELAQRMLARAHDHHVPVRAARQHAARQRRQQPGPHDRRLAAPGRPDDPEQRGADEPRDELGHEPLAPEEVRRVRDVERRQPPERAAHRRVVLAGPLGILASRLQLDHATGQLGLDGAQLGTACGGPTGSVVDATRRLAPRPSAGGLVHPARDPIALLHQPLGGRAALRGDRAHRLRVERLEHERVPRRDAQRVGVAAARQHQDVQLSERRHQLPERGAQLGGGALSFVEDNQGGAQRVAKLAERGDQPSRRTATGQVHDGAARAINLPRQLGGEPRLPDAVRAAYRDQPAVAGPRRLPMPAQPP